jgi:uncharacterized protein (TIGR03118 family)
MKKLFVLCFVPGIVLGLALMILVLGVNAAPPSSPSPHRPHFATLEVLCSDLLGVAENYDGHLVNPWGIAPGPAGLMHVADNATGVITRYSFRGNLLPAFTGSSAPRVIQLPLVSGTIPAAPTGIRLNPQGYGDAPDFALASGTLSGNSHYLLVTEDGGIAGINEQVWPYQAIVAVNTPEAVYKGLAVGMSGSNHLLYAANFASGNVEVFDNQFRPAGSGPGSGLFSGAFIDPGPVAGYAPVNIKVLHVPNPVTKRDMHYLAVAYAKQDALKHDPELGAGNGYINLFQMDGRFLKRLVDVGGPLNAPWGMAVSPRALGDFGRALVVGNFGDGLLHLFKLLPGPDGLPTGTPMTAPLSYKSGNPVIISGLQGLCFGRGPREALAAFLSDPDEEKVTADLYFTAGFLTQDHGLFGRLRIH